MSSKAFNNATKLNQIVSVTDYGAKGDGVTDDTAAIQAALNYVGSSESELFFPAGDYVITSGLTVAWATLRGEGPGASNLLFKDFSGKTGITFSATAEVDKSAGVIDLGIKLVNSQGATCISTPRGATLNNNRAKYFFRGLSFSGVDATAFTRVGFEQVYSWDVFIDLGDSWLAEIANIDALGRYRINVDPASQSLDTFLRMAGNQGILSARIFNITTHNIANGVDIRDRVFWMFQNVDIAQSYKGIFTTRNDATTVYGEGGLQGVVINAQLTCVDLEDRIATMCDHLTMNRANAGFDHGLEWVGLRLEDAEKCNFNNIKVYAGFKDPSGRFTGNQVGIKVVGGLNLNFSNVVLQAVDRGITTIVSAETTATPNGIAIANVASETSVTGSILFDMQAARRVQIANVVWNSGIRPTTIIQAGDTTTARNLQISNVYQLGASGSVGSTGAVQYTTDFGAAVDEKLWTLLSDNGDLRLQARSDSEAVITNAILVNRTGTTIDNTELRGTLVTLNGTNVRSTPLQPTVDNTWDLGSAALRWKVVYAGTGTINTSDEREKQDIETLNQAEKNVASALKGLVKKFRFKDAVQAKGDAARIHVGVIAQEVIAAFADEGLDATRYGILCFDEWEEQEAVLDENGNAICPHIPAGNRYGVRYEELLAFIISAI